MSDVNLRLGVELSIVRRLTQPSAGARRVVLPDRVPVWKGIPLDMPYAERPFAYEAKALSPEKPVCLAGEGLHQLYVAFGAPGTGKSFLLLRLLAQLATGDPPWGGLLLDPKQTLMADIRKAGIPETRFHVISKSDHHANVLRSHLLPRDLGVALALAAEAAGISTREPYWLNELKRLFGAGLSLLDVLGKELTLLNLAELLLGTKGKGEQRATVLALSLDDAERLDLAADAARRRDRAVAELAQFAATHGDNADTVRSFISQVLAPFLDPELDYLSDTAGPDRDSLADLIFDKGMWVMLAVPKSSLSVSRMLSALAKTLFQRAALDRSTIYPGNERQVFLFVDEYAELASDLPGEGFGDSIFFSQARQFKVLSFLATQGVSMLENSGVREAWKTILTNSAGKIFFRVADPDTAELAAKLLGESQLVVPDKSVARSAEGINVQRSEKLERRTLLTSDLFTTGLDRGQCVFIGTTEGKGIAGYHYVGVK